MTQAARPCSASAITGSVFGTAMVSMPAPSIPPLDSGAAGRYDASVMAEPQPEAAGSDAAEVGALFALVRQRYGDRMTAEELAAVREGIEGIVKGARALRAVRLKASDEPLQLFAPFRAEP